jgi:hypothetical protein
MSEKPSAFPLAWPLGWPRTPKLNREEGRFAKAREKSNGEGNYWTQMTKISIADARNRLGDELDKLGARYVTLSTNLELRLDGQPRTAQHNPADPGAAIYFQLDGKPMVLACDNFTSVAANMAAIAAHINAMRGMARWKVGRTEQMFAGYVALPNAVAATRPWWDVLGLRDDSGPLVGVEAAYRRLMREAHPDAGGSHQRASELNAAIAEARKVLK